MNVDWSVSKATSLSVLLPRFILLCVGAISRVKLWLLFTFAQQKHAYSSAKQNHSRCWYSDTHENNSIPSTAAPVWPKTGNVSLWITQSVPGIITFRTFSWLCNYIRKCPHPFLPPWLSKRPLFSCSAQRRRLEGGSALGQLRITVSPPGSDLATFCTNQ